MSKSKKKTLEKFGFKHVMPAFLKKNQDQFTAKEANKSRTVTIFRWVVEAANSYIKQWEMLGSRLKKYYLDVTGSREIISTPY